MRERSVLALVVLAAACNDGRLIATGTDPDAGLSTDGGVSSSDASPDATDAGVSSPDASPDAGVAASNLCNGTWCWTYPYPIGNTIESMWVASPTDIWIVGTAGIVLHGSGSTWSSTASAVTTELDDIFGFSASDIWAVGAAGHTVHWDGTAWSDVPNSANGVALYAVWGASPSDVWSAGDGLMMHWDGSTWTTTYSTTADFRPRFNAVWGTSASDVWCASSRSMWHFDGAQWTDMADTTIAATIWGSAPNDVWAFGAGIWHWDGSTWTTMSSQPWTGAALHHASGIAANDIWVTAESGEIYHWNGTSLSGLYPIEQFDHAALVAIAPNNVLVGGIWGDINHWDGSQWTNLGGSRGAVTGMWGAADDDVWAVNSNNILHWTGSTWTGVWPITGQPYSPTAVWGTSATNAMIVGANSGGYRWNGTSWSSLPMPGTANAVWGSAPNDYWAVGQDGGPIYHFDGTSWSTAVPSLIGVYDQLRAVYGTSATDVYAVGDGGSIGHYDGTAWTFVYQNDALYFPFGVWASAPNDVWIASMSGIFHYDGTTAVQVSPLHTLHIWGRNATDIWATGENGALYHYDGTAWTASQSYTTNWLRSVYGTANTMWIAGDYGSILRHL